MSYGLALAGGGARGAAHAGVLLALKEANLLPEAIGGTSAGSIAAGLFACGMEPEELCDLVHYLSNHGSEYLDLNLLALLGLIPRLLLGQRPRICGLLKGHRLLTLFRKLTRHRRLEEVKRPLLVPSVDLHTGTTLCFTNLPHILSSGGSSGFPGKSPANAQKTGSASGDQQILWLSSGSLAEILMASCSVPGIFCPVTMDSFCLVDGGVTNNLPVDLMRDAGIRTVAAVDIGSPYRMPERESIFEILSHSFSIMSGNLKDCRSMGETVLLKPQLPADAGLFSFDRMEACMETAYRDTKKHLSLFYSLSNESRI